MTALRQAAAAAAIAGGLLRIADSFTGGVLSPGVLQALYFATDVLLLAGAAALWAQRRATLGWAGNAGLIVFALGILTIRVLGNYQIGATVAILGLSLYALETIVRRTAPIRAPIAWLIALAAGVIGALGYFPAAMLAVAGTAFGIGFVFAGLDLVAE